MNATQMKNQGFTLVELLVVVAIIAVIGAGVAVTYQRLDDKAKTAMEMSDVSILKKVVKHWSAVNDYKVPNELDSLVDDEGNLYSLMDDDSGTFTGYATPSSSGKGLNGPAGFTFEVHEAPDVVLENLATAGMTLTYTHLVSAQNANDSTFTAGVGGSVDTSNTQTTLVAGDSESRADAQTIVDADDSAHDYGSGPFVVGSHSYASAAELDAAQVVAQQILDAKTTDRLAFIYPGGGAQMSMGPMGSFPAPMNVTDEIITNAGLTPDVVADPTASDFSDKKYFLVAMGFGRFASIYKGKAIRADAPVVGKRQGQNAGTYNRYLAVFRVPVAEYNTMTGSSEMPVLVDVLTPQGYSVAALRDNYIDDETKVRD